MGSQLEVNRQRFQGLLRDLFQFDSADLDFGVYRILSQKRHEIDRFIQEELIKAVEDGLRELIASSRADLEEALAGKAAALGDSALDDKGKVRKEFRELPVALDYTKTKSQLEDLEVAEGTEAMIFDDLYRFFYRYYDGGDFLPLRRYSSRESKFLVPYDGQEVFFHWANRDQYYIKTSERFTDYRFDVGKHKVWFRLHRAEVPSENVKGEGRDFVVREEDPVTYDSESKTLTVNFEYRPLTTQERERFLERYNENRTTGSRRRSLDRRVLGDALSKEILDKVPYGRLKERLEQGPGEGGSSLILHHLNRYSARNTMDYFIHKDLGRFLRGELELFLKTDVLRTDDFIQDESAATLQMQLLRASTEKRIADKIIDFLAQIEDFQRRLFEKKKFVVKTDYCVTLDQVPAELYADILENEAQLQEWKWLYNIEKWDKNLLWRGTFDREFLKNHPHLMIDTASFDEEFTARLLASFDDIDAGLDGILVHGENFQALNLLAEKYSRQAYCAYIDPPYNTGNDNFLYKDNYQHSSWLAMMRDRLGLSRGFLADDGAIFVSIDDHELVNLRHTMEEVFGKQNFGTTITWRRKKESANDSAGFSRKGEYLLCFFASEEGTVHPLPLSEDYLKGSYKEPNDEFPEGRWRPVPIAVTLGHQSRGYEYEVVTPKGTAIHREWLYPRESFDELGKKGRLYWGQNNDGVPQRVMYAHESRGVPPDNIWYNLATNKEGKKALIALFGEAVYDTPKPPSLIERTIEITEEAPRDGGFVIDFFAGSGTTAHAVINLNRKDGARRRYILIEVDRVFDRALKPRILKLAFSANWKEGVPTDQDGISHFIKYHRIESYEDSLNNIVLGPMEEAQRKLLYEEMDDYILHYMLNFESQGSPSLLAKEAFKTPFDYKLKIRLGQESPEQVLVDLVETFHYLIGMHVESIERHKHQNREYRVTRGHIGGPDSLEEVVTVWRATNELELEQEAEWAEKVLLREPVDRVFVNGPSFIKGSEPVEIAFMERMEETVFAS